MNSPTDLNIVKLFITTLFFSSFYIHVFGLRHKLSISMLTIKDYIKLVVVMRYVNPLSTILFETVSTVSICRFYHV